MWLDKRVLAAGAAALLLLTGCAAETVQAQPGLLTGAAADKAKTYETYEVSANDITKSGSMTMSVTYTQRQTLYAPDNGLYLDGVEVQRRQVVREGETIAVFHRQSSEADLAEAKLALQRAEENQTAQREKLQEALDQAAQNAYGEEGQIRLELAQLAYDRAEYQAQRQQKTLQAAVDKAEEAFHPVKLVAPYDCIVDTIEYLYNQQEVSTSTAIVRISRVSSMVLVGETGTSNFQYGNQIRIEYGKKERRGTVSGHVISTSTLLDRNDQKIWIIPDEPIDGDELEKASAKTEIIQLRDALTVPRAAIEIEGGNSYVQILVDGVVHKRYIIRGITVGSTSDSHVVVLSGLKEGQSVITN